MPIQNTKKIGKQQMSVQLRSAVMPASAFSFSSFSSVSGVPQTLERLVVRKTEAADKRGGHAHLVAAARAFLLLRARSHVGLRTDADGLVFAHRKGGKGS